VSLLSIGFRSNTTPDRFTGLKREMHERHAISDGDAAVSGDYDRQRSRCSTMPRNESDALSDGSSEVQRRTTKVCTTQSAAKSLDFTLLSLELVLAHGGFSDLHAEIVAPVVSAAFGSC
jgi:hypothetical protein